MGNQAATNPAQLTAQATKMDDGLKKYIADLKTTRITEPEFATQLTEFVAQDNSYNAARSSRQAASDSYQAAMGNVADWLQVTKSVLMGRFGNQWSSEWVGAGFTNPSIAIPKNAAAQLALVLRLVSFFTSNPSYEVASMKVTAAQGTTLRDAANTAQEVLATSNVTLNTISLTWQTAYDALIASVRVVIDLCGHAYADDDPRWLAYGLNMPATNTTPGQPVDVTAHLDTNGNIVVQWLAVSLAERYRVRMLIVGVQTDYTLVARTVDPMGLISGVEPGQTVQIIVQAVNGGSQGVASEPIQFEVLIPEATAPEVKAPVLEIEPVSANGTNGHRNGHAMVAATRG